VIDLEKPVLVIMAAGLGSRFGGLKQIEPIDEQGHLIMDFSVYDAVKAGFEKVILIIKKETEDEFRKRIGNRLENVVDVEYVYQSLEDIPQGYVVPQGREKPWGTGHAVLSCRNKVNGPFAVINADDYYGRQAFRLIYDYLSGEADGGNPEKYHYAMVGYNIENTLSENGYVARGVCRIDDKNNLVGIKERTRIELVNGLPAYSEDEGKTWNVIPPGTTVSMNMWGFITSLFDELGKRFHTFLQTKVKENPLKAEYFLPDVVGELIKEGKAEVKVLKTPDKWYGMTYKEDKAVVKQAIARYKKENFYPERLWT